MPPAVVVRCQRYFAAVYVQVLIVACLIGTFSPWLSAKDVPLNAIVLYDSPKGAAYVQMTDIMLNGKTELRVCTLGSKLDKSGYGKLGKVQLRGALSLERNADGVLMLTREQQPMCVLPGNLHLEGNNEFSPAELADQAVLQGTVTSSSDNGSNEVPALKPGVSLIFVAAPDTELAEFLRCQRAKSIPVWQQFLSRYPSSFHSADARKSLAGLFEESAESALAQYQKSTGAAVWPSLKQARQQAEQATRTVQSYAPAVGLLGKIQDQLALFTATDRAELQTYRTALVDQTAGYAHLTAARRLNDQILDVDANYVPALELQSDLIKEAATLDATVLRSENLLAAKRYDEARLGLGAYRNFAPEVPRVEAVVAAVYDFHFSRGKEFAGQQNWDQAVLEFRKALETRTDSQQAQAALNDAEIQLTNTRNREAAERAIAASKTYAEQKQDIDAYEVLANLSPPQQALVTSQMEAVKTNYIAAAVKRAQTLEEVHLPIRGRADEDAVRQAYQLLARASSLSDEPSVRLKRDLLADKISSYYVEQSKRYLEKPMASTVGLGWYYLREAQLYKQNLDSVKDLMTRYEAAYQLRARLSVGVVIRDETSRRESGFADQLADAIATDLESSSFPVKVVRQAGGTTSEMRPLFQLVGEINEHRTVKNPTLEVLQSKYRAGTREVKNEAWVKANHEYESAQQDVNNAQHAYDQAVGRNKKKEIEAARDALTAAQKKANDVRVKLDAIDQTRIQDVVEPYNYNKTTIDLAGVIGMAFRVVDIDNNLIEPTTPLKQESHKVYVILDNVKPEDTEGVKAQNVPPDESAFMTDLEIQARDVLVKSIHEKVARLPAKILEQARQHAQQNDAEGTAEWYVIYLNATPDTASPERDEALRYLREHFNVSWVKPS